ncbi:RecA/RadA recombinase [Caballeronia sordidicola]|uniref:RecA/RadA recombinase n=1 Tax=Caballeronia sordidicola TaxID=196367 RepID=A0A242N480_CABSO|nr:RecA/RadA recombinase [Caballeronia sordidicola]
MTWTATDGQQIRPPEERARSLNAALTQLCIRSRGNSLWRGTQLARAHGRTVDTGYAALSAELPGGGWPLGTMTELLLQQAGVGEMRLLGPAMAAVSNKRSIALIAP